MVTSVSYLAVREDGVKPRALFRVNESATEFNASVDSNSITDWTHPVQTVIPMHLLIPRHALVTRSTVEPIW